MRKVELITCIYILQQKGRRKEVRYNFKSENSVYIRQPTKFKIKVLLKYKVAFEYNSKLLHSEFIIYHKLSLTFTCALSVLANNSVVVVGLWFLNMLFINRIWENMSAKTILGHL